MLTDCICFSSKEIDDHVFSILTGTGFNKQTFQSDVYEVQFSVDVIKLIRVRI